MRKLKGYEPSDGITNSILQSWLACEKRAALSLQGWEKPSGHSRFIEFGNLFHGILERWYDPRLVGNSLKTFADAEEWFRQDALARGYDADAMEEDLAMAEPVWIAYHKRYLKDDQKKEWLAAEQNFDVPWRGFRLRGKIDGVFRSGKKVWLFETKTKSRIDKNDIELTVGFDPQALYYLNAYQALTNCKVTPIGVLYNVVRRPGLERKDGESLRDFSARIADDVAKKPEHYFHRFEAVFSKKRVAAFQDMLETKLGRFADWCAEGMEQYMRECSCTGRYACKYLECCARDSMVGFTQTGKLFSELA